MASALFSELKVKDVTFRNRIGVAPMCQYKSVDGAAQPWHMQHVGSLAIGGAGLIIAEATAVTPEGRITPHCAGLWNDAQAEALKPITAFAREYGAVPGIQIGHAGRKGSSARPWDGGAHLSAEEGGYTTYGPSSEPFDEDGTRLWKAPHQLSDLEIGVLQQQFVAAARRALEAGYQLLELHAAHGYLLHSFFTPLVNKRTDKYGGSAENRARMLLETTEKVRAVWPENLPLAVRVSTTDWVDGGVTVDDNIQLAKWLKERGVDLIDCSTGGAVPASRASIGPRISEQAELCGQLRRGADIMTMAVGEITTPQRAEEVITTGLADIALLGRQVMREPYFPVNAARALGEDAAALMADQKRFFIGKG